MKKTIIIIALVTILVIAALSLWIDKITNPWVDIAASPCDEHGERIVIGSLRVQSYSDHGRDFTFLPKSEADVPAMVERSPHYAGVATLDLEGAIISGWLFHKNNNSYILYRHSSGDYILSNVYSISSINGSEIVFPTLTRCCIAPEELAYAKERNLDLMSGFFDWFNYEQAKNFYHEYDQGYVCFDDDNQRIFVTSYDTKQEQYSTYPNVMLDFSIRSIGYRDAEGNTSYFDETTK